MSVIGTTSALHFIHLLFVSVHCKNIEKKSFIPDGATLKYIKCFFVHAIKFFV